MLLAVVLQNWHSTKQKAVSVNTQHECDVQQFETIGGGGGGAQTTESHRGRQGRLPSQDLSVAGEPGERVEVKLAGDREPFRGLWHSACWMMLNFFKLVYLL